MRFLNRSVLMIITFYRRAISPFLPPTCRFQPTCSEYATQAFQKYNFFKAMRLAIIRILKCHPFHRGGDDPLP